jgi:hypothetical protein
MKTTATIGALLLSLTVTAHAYAETSPAATLDAFHRAAADANQSAFIAQLAADAVLLGVEEGARLQGQSLRDYVSDRFTNSNTWTYRGSNREIQLSADGSVAWFDESLQHEQLGAGRASGVLIANGGDWKIAQFNLTVPLRGAAVVSPASTSGAAVSTATAAPQKPECKQLRHKTNKKSSC